MDLKRVWRSTRVASPCEWGSHSTVAHRSVSAARAIVALMQCLSTYQDEWAKYLTYGLQACTPLQLESLRGREMPPHRSHVARAALYLLLRPKIHRHHRRPQIKSPTSRLGINQKQFQYHTGFKSNRYS